MKKIFILLFAFPAICYTLSAQQILIFTEDFETGGTSFSLDTGGMGLEVGSNRWIINDEYDGGGVYPETPNQDSTVSGTIGGSPFSTYLHVHDENSAPGIANTNFDPAAGSDRFAYTLDGFCTLGMDSIIIAFFYIGEGSPNAYGEFYYSLNGGAWIQAGQHRYSGESKWRYETVSETAFAKVNNLRFGFRWVNDPAAPPSTISFGIDDIVVVANYDEFNDPITIDIIDVFPDPICQLDFLFIEWELSEPLCVGTYRIELSGPGGSFANAANLGVFTIGSLDTTGFIASQIPATTSANGCYRIRINRIGPFPIITGEASICFEVMECPNEITTLPPVVTTDPDTVCSLSAIDVPFISTGVYAANNIYIAQLSDSSGSFDNPQTLGTLPSSETYDPAIGAMPGTVSGLIPETPAGCNYYIRVISTNPQVTGSLYGPFCIAHCDILTNNTIDLHFCIMENEGAEDTITIDINYWDDDASYFLGNEFMVQLLDMMSLAVVNVGGLGVEVDTASTTLIVIVPGLNQLLAMGIAPGTYYMRIIADSSTEDWNDLGTIIRITIGAPADNAASIITDDTIRCNVGIVSFLIDPYNPDSDYEWLSQGINGGFPFIWAFNPLLVDFTGAPIDEYTFRVREINFGCYGPWSDPVSIDIIGVPNVEITGPIEVCVGDTAEFEVPFITATYYEWALNWGTIIEASNNEFSVLFDSVGQAGLSIFALNECGEQEGDYSLEVISIVDVSAGEDKSICRGDSVTLEASSSGFDVILNTDFGGSQSFGNMFDITALADVTINGFDQHFNAPGTADVRIYFKQGSYVGFENDDGAWTLAGAFVGLQTTGAGTLTELPLPLNISIPASQTYAFYITTTNGFAMRNSPGTNTGDLFLSDGNIEIYEGTMNDYPFGSALGPRVWNGNIHYFTFGAFVYSWSSGQTEAEIKVAPEETETFRVRISDTTGCGNNDTVRVVVNPSPDIDAGPDTVLCLDNSLLINAVGSPGVYRWQPETGLSDPTILDPTATPTETIDYILSATDTTTSLSCKTYDTLRVMVLNCLDPLHVPQAFTPNGDGVNDFFTIFADGITEYDIKIFNRWGELIYNSNNVEDLNNLQRGWDGYHKGKEQNLGTYVYYIVAKDLNNVTVEKQGNVTLIR